MCPPKRSAGKGFLFPAGRPAAASLSCLPGFLRPLPYGHCRPRHQRSNRPSHRRAGFVLPVWSRTLPGIPGNDSEVSEFFKVANKDRLTKLVAEAEAKRNQSGIKSAYAEAVSSLQILDVSQQKVDQAYEKLLSVLNPKNPPEISPPTTDATAPTNSSNSTAPTNPSDSTQGAGGKGDSATPPSSADDPSASNIVTENPPSDDPGEAHETTVPDEEGNSNIKDLSSETSDNTELTDENTSSQGSNWQIWCIAGGCIVLIVAAVIAMFYLKKKKLLWWKE